MNRFRDVVLAALVAAVCGVLVAPVAVASEAEGCFGIVTSQSQFGEQVSVDRPPDSAASPDDPFIIDPAGKITWFGEASTVITGGTVTLTVLGIPVVQYSAPNTEGSQLHEGTYAIADLPAPAQWLLRSAAVIPVTMTLTGEGGVCSVSGYVTGVPVDGISPVTAGGVLILLVGALILVACALTTRRLPQTEFLPEGYDGEDFGTETSRHPVFAFIGGFIAGLGLAVLLLSFGVIPLQLGWLIGIGAAGAVLATIGAYLVPPRPARTE